MPVTRNDLDMEFVNRELHRNTPYTVIAWKEAERLGLHSSMVSRSMISGIHRDLKNGKLEVNGSGNKASREWVKTYRFGIDEDNGGVPVFVGEPRLDIDRAIVAGDPHFPETNYSEVERVSKAGAYYNATDLILAGDMLDAGSQSMHQKRVKVPPLQLGFDMAQQALSFWLETFDRIWIEPGNHDDWFLNGLEGELTIKSYGRLMGLDGFDGRVVMTPYDRIHLFSGTQEYVIPHMAEASAQPLSVLEKLSWEFQANIIGPHQHKNAVGMDRYGRYVLISMGGLHEQTMMAYKNLKTTTKPNYNSGFVAVVDGQYELITPDIRQMGNNKF